MVLVTRYTHLQKRNPGESFLTFAPLRAVGLSVEAGWKLARDKGGCTVTSEELGQVAVSGDLLVNGAPARQCHLQLRTEDAKLTETLLHKQRTLFSELGFNVWAVDFWEEGCSKRLDLVGDFGVRQNFGVQGRVWVELKVFSDATFKKEVEKWKAKLVPSLDTECERDSTLKAVLLLAARVPRASGGRWGTPTLHPMMMAQGADDWVSLTGMRRAARGQAKGVKPPLATLWSKMEWHLTEDGQRVGLLKHFLQSLGLPLKHTGQRASTLNGLLKKGGKTGRLVETKLKSKAGRKPWVARKDTFRDIYQCL